MSFCLREGKRGAALQAAVSNTGGKTGGAWQPVMRVWLFACVRQALRALRADEGGCTAWVARLDRAKGVLNIHVGRVRACFFHVLRIESR